MNEQELARLLAEYEISEDELPVILAREQRRKWNADTELAYQLIWEAAHGPIGMDAPSDWTLSKILEGIDDVTRLRELVAMFAQSDYLHVRECDELKQQLLADRELWAEGEAALAT
jgi:hypothetical protein